MSYFAKVKDGKVTEVISADQEYINTFPDAEKWFQTSYNTRGGIHYGQDDKPDGGTALRMNFAGISYGYDSIKDAFIPIQPYLDWILDDMTCLWRPPISKPIDGEHFWDQSSHTWLPVVF